MFDINGYLDFEFIFNNKMTYKFIVGGRGTGKTFGVLKYVLDHNLKFIFMRRTQVQVDMIKSDELNPFNALYTELGNKYHFVMKKINKNITGVYKGKINDKNDYVATGEPLGYIMALSTISNIRGFDASDVKVLIYDEFIGEKHEKSISSEGTAFLNAIETIARNREIKGAESLKVVCLSNSNDLANPIFIELKLVSICEKMIQKKLNYRNIPERELALFIINDSPISRKKAETSLYKLSGSDSNFSRMSIKNEWANEYMNLIASKNLINYRVLVKVGEIVIYENKNKRDFYVTGHASGTYDYYDTSAVELKRFRNSYDFLLYAYLNKNIFFESYIEQVLFEKYIGIC